jgi:hypothetical protein
MQFSKKGPEVILKHSGFWDIERPERYFSLGPLETALASN